MRIGNNISAMNTLNRLTVNNSSLSKSLEKLSSGSAINRAADDAAGLAISEKMRAQIAGLEQASKNAQDGISLVQTAEGALDQTHTALRRMETLAMKATNGTITSEDRAKIQAEVDARTSEIDRVADTSNFNGIKLFDGTLGAGKASLNTAGAAVWGKGHVTEANAASVVKVEGVSLNKAGSFTFQGSTDGKTFHTLAAGDTHVRVSFTDSTTGEVSTTDLKLEDIVSGALGAAGTEETYDFSSVGLGKITVQASATATASMAAVANGDDTLVTGSSLITLLGDAANLTVTATAAAAGDGLTLQIGPTADSADQITVSINKMDSASLLGSTKLDMSTPDAANAAMTKISAAIEKVSEQRANLGAVQNRLEQTIENLSTTAENMSAAESRIRDVDMAKQMTEFTKFSILSQASQAMLAQANSLPQGVLQLLK
ncbi:flagellin [Acetanaerobacterium elongatum]|uniref:Flagellin n=1 Tax=Acetanaerobacterium elongatum TaxID=258515 RepID=A0A1G9V2N7_9FIRM|nr:flagellin [Acetanaerobacterium elongatum]SDM66541.1 flagellin [Acetanaerobacterium elongatum]